MTLKGITARTNQTLGPYAALSQPLATGAHSRTATLQIILVPPTSQQSVDGRQPPQGDDSGMKALQQS